MKKNILNIINKSRSKGRKLLAVLIDPDKFNPEVVKIADKTKVDFIFLGGSEVKTEDFNKSVKLIKKITKIPTVIFPGNENQISSRCDALLLLSLVSGLNPEYLFGKQIKAAKTLKKSGLEIISTAYLMIDGGRSSSASKVTNTTPIHPENIELIVSTSIASELLGFNMLYLEAGSGARVPLSSKTIKSVKKEIKIPLICGGGIDTAQKCKAYWTSGGDVVVVGNAIENNPALINELTYERNKLNRKQFY